MQVRASVAPGTTAEEMDRVYRLRADTAEQRDAWLATLLGALTHGKARVKEAATAVRLLLNRMTATVRPGPPG